MKNLALEKTKLKIRITDQKSITSPYLIKGLSRQIIFDKSYMRELVKRMRV